jgi:uncharacterized protein YbjT (DUF2867 family)
MTRLLVTGGNGGLGRAVVARLPKAGYGVRVMSRQPRPAHIPLEVEWALADLETGAGLREAVTDVDVIIHAATNPFKHTQQIDVEGTRSLIQAALIANVQHFIHVSIVGIERIPHPYYLAKVAGEGVVRGGGLPYTILRATQFHSLIVGMFLARYQNLPLGLLPIDFKYQTIDTGEVADRLVQLAAQPPAGLLPDMGGPQVLTLGEMAGAWFAAQGKHCKLFRLPIPGAMGQAFQAGYNTCPDHRDGKITWAEWVRGKYP